MAGRAFEKHNSGIDALRGIAILSVILLHYFRKLYLFSKIQRPEFFNPNLILPNNNSYFYTNQSIHLLNEKI